MPARFGLLAGWQGAVAAAQGRFSKDGNIPVLQKALVDAAAQFVVH